MNSTLSILAPNMMLMPQFKLYAACCVILSLQMLLLGAMTAATRASRKVYVNPEDDKVSPKDAKFLEAGEHPDVARVIRAHRNMLETLPLFFALGLVFVLSHGSMLGAEICFGGFTIGRILHSIAYIKGLQPWRTMAFGIVILSLFGLCGQIVYALLA